MVICSVEDLMLEHKELLTQETVSDEMLDPKSLSSTQQQSQLGVLQQSNTVRSALSGPPCASA